MVSSTDIACASLQSPISIMVGDITRVVADLDLAPWTVQVPGRHQGCGKEAHCSEDLIGP